MTYILLPGKWVTSKISLNCDLRVRPKGLKPSVIRDKLVCGGTRVAHHLHNRIEDRLLAVLYQRCRNRGRETGITKLILQFTIGFKILGLHETGYVYRRLSTEYWSIGKTGIEYYWLTIAECWTWKLNVLTLKRWALNRPHTRGLHPYQSSFIPPNLWDSQCERWVCLLLHVETSV